MNQRPRYERHFRTRGWDGCFVVFWQTLGGHKNGVDTERNALLQNTAVAIHGFIESQTLLGCPAGT